MQYINYIESRQRGTVDFPLEYHHVTVHHPHYIMALHWHVEFEIVYILKGTFQVTIDEQTYVISKGESAFIPAGALHSGIPTDCIYECIVFDMNMLINKNDSCCKLIRKVVEHEVQPMYVFPDSYNNIHQIIRSILEVVASRKDGYQAIALGGLYQLIGTIFTEQYFEKTPVQSNRHHRRIEQLKTVLEYMESGYNKSISLKEMSNCIGMSPKYFCRFFQEMTHRTPVDYLNYYRIERACYQLLTTDHSITEVAYQSGFNDLSYFIKTFKKYKGITPKQYLKA